MESSSVTQFSRSSELMNTPSWGYVIVESVLSIMFSSEVQQPHCLWLKREICCKRNGHKSTCNYKASISYHMADYSGFPAKSQNQILWIFQLDRAWQINRINRINKTNRINMDQLIYANSLILLIGIDGPPNLHRSIDPYWSYWCYWSDWSYWSAKPWLDH